MRKVIQIITGMTGSPYMNDTKVEHSIYALCDDGTIATIRSRGRAGRREWERSNSITSRPECADAYGGSRTGPSA